MQKTGCKKRSQGSRHDDVVVVDVVCNTEDTKITARKKNLVFIKWSQRSLSLVMIICSDINNRWGTNAGMKELYSKECMPILLSSRDSVFICVGSRQLLYNRWGPCYVRVCMSFTLINDSYILYRGLLYDGRNSAWTADDFERGTEKKHQ